MYQNYNIRKFSFFSFFISINSKKIKNTLDLKKFNQRINLVQKKQTHINFLLKEIQYKKKRKKIEEYLLKENILKKVKQIQQEICFDIPNAFKTDFNVLFCHYE